MFAKTTIAQLNDTSSFKVNITVGTGTRASWPHNQKGGGASVKTFPNVGTRGFLTNSIQRQIPQDFFNIADPLPLRRFDAQPFWLYYHSYQTLLLKLLSVNPNKQGADCRYNVIA